MIRARDATRGHQPAIRGTRHFAGMDVALSPAMTNPLVELDLQTLSHVTGGTAVHVEIVIDGQRVDPQAAAGSGVHVSVGSSPRAGRPSVGGPSPAGPSADPRLAGRSPAGPNAVPLGVGAPG